MQSNKDWEGGREAHDALVDARLRSLWAEWLCYPLNRSVTGTLSLHQWTTTSDITNVWLNYVADLVYNATDDSFTTSNIALQRLTWRLWNELYEQRYTISHSVTLNGTIAEPERRVQTPEEIEAERQRQHEVDLQMVERSRLRKLASTRADRLLQSHLTAA